jgi:predicted nuclease of restriction endonuclease-like (RecB) superfamily
VPITPTGADLFERVASILEQARSNVVIAVNTQMVSAYWLIGREIVLELQGGEERAEYGKQLLENLSQQINARFGSGYSLPNLQNFRKLYLVYKDRFQIQYPAGTELNPGLTELTQPVEVPFFSPQLSWSHYRTLMRVENPDARKFYEEEAIAAGWRKAELLRQIHSFYFERLQKSRNPQAMIATGRTELIAPEPASDVLKNPYVLEFLGLPEVAVLRENHLENAIITHLQSFLLELGKGFAFVARQKRLIFDDQDYYVDLVFYNCILKCYLLIDLKIGSLTHQDVGQMDGYVRMFDKQYIAKDDNQTIGLILCTEKKESVARYSVLNERKQIFASKYMLYLPTEAELSQELARERKLIEEQLEDLKNEAIE